jgi:hypothetical protein
MFGVVENVVVALWNQPTNSSQTKRSMKELTVSKKTVKSNF